MLFNWYIHSRIIFRRKKEQITSGGTKWINLTNIMMNVIRQTQKDMQLYGSIHIYADRNQISGCSWG